VTAPMALLEIDDVSHAFSGSPVLREVSVTVDPGSAWAVVGPNGAGKTTLIRIAAGLLESEAGRVELSGDPAAGLGRREIARRVSLLRQAAPQTFGFSALEIVLMAFHARTGRFSVPSSAERERALEAMERLEVAHLADRPAPVLSGGELQRVLMARTLAGEAPIWLLDEPTAHLDVRHRLTLLDQVRTHCASGGGVVAAVHDLSLVDRFFDRALVLDGGRPVAAGPVDETLTEDLVGEVFEVDMRRGEVAGSAVWVPVPG